MILELLRRSEFADVAKLCTPRLFSVLPAGVLATAVRRLVATRGSTHHRSVCARIGQLHADDGVTLVPSLRRTAGPSDDAGRAELGARLLRLYFRQLFHAEEALLDVRPSAFAFAPERLEWAPAALSVAWEPRFVASLREVYRGFYHDDDERFRSALAELSLSAAEDLFRRHFGADPTSVRFATKEFTHTFGLVFDACAASGAKLSGDFVPFGFLLAALYQSLEPLGIPLDVRAAFDAVVPRRHRARST